jgi:hypothetical protein
MIGRLVVLTAVAGLFAAAPAGAQEKYAIKIKESGQGDSFVYSIAESGKSTTKAVDANGGVLKDSAESKGKTYVYAVTILEQKAGDKRATALRRSYEKASTTRDDQPKVSDLEGKTVLIEKKGDKYTFRFEGGAELTAAQAAELDQDFNKRKSTVSDEDMMAKNPVAVGESWNIDPAVFLKGIGSEEDTKVYDPTKAKLTGKLVRVYEKDKRRFGVVEFDIEIPFKANLEVEKGNKIVGGNVVMKATFDGCIDGSVFARTLKGNWTVDLRLSVDVGGKDVAVNVLTTAQMDESYVDVTRKK